MQKRLAVLFLLLIAASSVYSQTAKVKESLLAIAARSIFPQGNLQESYSFGYGLALSYERRLSRLFSVGAEAGFNNFVKNDEAPGGAAAIPDLQIFTLGPGGKLNFGAFYIGADVPYFFGDVKSFEVINLLGFRWKRFDATLDYKVTSDSNVATDQNWFAVRLGWNFLKW